MTSLEERIWKTRGYLVQKYRAKGYRTEEAIDKSTDCIIYTLNRLKHYKEDKGGFMSFIDMSFQSFNFENKRKENTLKRDGDVVRCEGMMDEVVDESMMSVLNFHELLDRDKTKEATIATMEHWKVDRSRVEEFNDMFIELLYGMMEGYTIKELSNNYNFSYNYLRNMFSMWKGELKRTLYI